MILSVSNSNISHCGQNSNGFGNELFMIDVLGRCQVFKLIQIMEILRIQWLIFLYGIPGIEPGKY